MSAHGRTANFMVEKTRGWPCFHHNLNLDALKTCEIKTFIFYGVFLNKDISLQVNSRLWAYLYLSGSYIAAILCSCQLDYMLVYKILSGLRYFGNKLQDIHSQLQAFMSPYWTDLLLCPSISFSSRKATANHFFLLWVDLPENICFMCITYIHTQKHICKVSSSKCPHMQAYKQLKTRTIFHPSKSLKPGRNVAVFQPWFYFSSVPIFPHTWGRKISPSTKRKNPNISRLEIIVYTFWWGRATR